MSLRVLAAKAAIAFAKKDLERGWEKRGSKKAEVDAIRHLAEALDGLRKEESVR
jgi:hypothetical protein